MAIPPDLSNTIGNIKIVGVKLRALSVAMNPRKGVPGRPSHIQASVRILVDNQNCICNCAFANRTLEKKILKIIDPTLKRKDIRSKALRGAMNSVMLKIRNAADQVIQKLKPSEIQKMVAKAKVSAARAYQNRLLKEKQTRRDVCVDSIRIALTGDAKDLSLEDLTSIWEECQVAVIMES